MVLRVRERFDLARPVVSANSESDCGCVLWMRASKARFLSERTWDMVSRDWNQTLGSLRAGTYSPRAMAMVRCLYCSRVAIPTLSVVILCCYYRVITPPSRGQEYREMIIRFAQASLKSAGS